MNEEKDYPHPAQVPIEEQLENLKTQLDWQKKESRIKAYDLAVKTMYDGDHGLVQHTPKTLVEAAETIYEGLTRDFK